MRRRKQEEEEVVGATSVKVDNDHQSVRYYSRRCGVVRVKHQPSQQNAEAVTATYELRGADKKELNDCFNYLAFAP